MYLLAVFGKVMAIQWPSITGELPINLLINESIVNG